MLLFIDSLFIFLHKHFIIISFFINFCWVFLNLIFKLFKLSNILKICTVDIACFLIYDVSNNEFYIYLLNCSIANYRFDVRLSYFWLYYKLWSLHLFFLWLYCWSCSKCTFVLFFFELLTIKLIYIEFFFLLFC